MELLSVIPLALALAVDAFAVSVGLGVSGKLSSWKQRLRLAFFFGLFQFLMPLLGWAAGSRFIGLIRGFDHWAAFGLLVFIGLKMIRESFHSEEKSLTRSSDPTRGGTLILLSVATSIDALAVGLSLAILGHDVLFPAVIIGAAALIITYAGGAAGPILGKAVGRKAELAGGVVLILIGIRILSEHL